MRPVQVPFVRVVHVVAVGDGGVAAALAVDVVVAGVHGVRHGHVFASRNVSTSDANTGSRAPAGRNLLPHPIAAVPSELINPGLSV
ncbi:hypothetical protein GCM10027258_93700 [Amycolatopsis stemonae]